MNVMKLVTDAIRALQDESPDRVIVVAVDGRSGAGKSTLATALAGELNAALVHVDDFYRDMPDADRLALTPAQGVDRFFDWERIRDEAVATLVRREPARFRCFDWDAGSGLTSAITIEPRDIVIVEGVYSARPELGDLLELTVLVEALDVDRQQRRDERHRTVSRHDPHGWDARWDRSEDIYFDTIRPRETFDLIVSGGSSS
jgi:uridine kinase